MTREEIRQVFRKIPILHTRRLMLRRICSSDVDDMFEYSSDPAVTRYLTWAPHPNRKYTARYISFLDIKYDEGRFYDWGIILRGENKMIGTCGFTRFSEENNSAECGYVINPRYWGQGIAAEALTEVMRFGFMTLRLHRIECRYMVGNDNSRRVMEKAGLTYEGTNRDAVLVGKEYKTVGVCAIIADDFLKRYRAGGAYFYR